VFTLQTLPACDEPFGGGCGKVAGFSLHAGVAARADQRQKLERLCRYISRPAIAEQRRSLTPHGNVRYQLKTPYRDGTTHVIFEPLDFIARLAALVPKPRVNLTRFHGLFAPNSKHHTLLHSDNLNVRFQAIYMSFELVNYCLQCVGCCRYCMTESEAI